MIERGEDPQTAAISRGRELGLHLFNWHADRTSRRDLLIGDDTAADVPDRIELRVR